MSQFIGCIRKCVWSSQFGKFMILMSAMVLLAAAGFWVTNRNNAVASNSGAADSNSDIRLSSPSSAIAGNTDDDSEIISPQQYKRSDLISNTHLITHEGKTVLFRDDLVKDKKVVVNFMYTVCNGICPGMTQNIRKVRNELAAKGVDDITFISISIEPDRDTPAQLTKYMKNHNIENKPGLCPWIFLTGDLEDIDKLRRSLGVYDPDPVVDADRRQHGGTLTYGNDRSDWWGATPALQSPELTVQTLVRQLSSDQPKRPGFITK